MSTRHSRRLPGFGPAPCHRGLVQRQSLSVGIHRTPTLNATESQRTSQAATFRNRQVALEMTHAFLPNFTVLSLCHPKVILTARSLFLPITKSTPTAVKMFILFPDLITLTLLVMPKQTIVISITSLFIVVLTSTLVTFVQ